VLFNKIHQTDALSHSSSDGLPYNNNNNTLVNNNTKLLRWSIFLNIHYTITLARKRCHVKPLVIKENDYLYTPCRSKFTAASRGFSYYLTTLKNL